MAQASGSIDIATGVQAVQNDGIQLSAPGKINMAAMTTTFGITAGGPIASFALENVAGPVLDSIVTAMVEVSGSLKDAAEMVSALGSTAPILGAALGIVAFAMSAVAEDEQRAADYCRDYLALFKPRPSGSEMAEGCKECPIDLFALVVPPDKFHYGETAAPSMRLRPAIGQALMFLTETDPWGSMPDQVPANEIRYGGPGPKQRKRGNSAPLIHGKGVRTARRVLFRKVRRAIEASAPIDKGQAVWPLYLDLLAREFREGNLSGPYIKSALATAGGWFGPEDGPCQGMLANHVVGIVNDWNLETKPSSLLGKAKIAEFEKVAAEVAARVVGQAHPVAIRRLRLEVRRARKSSSLPLYALGAAAGAKLLGFW